ncbi:MAG: phenylacetate-CoA oxygenase/reductase subunit PaaK [Sphingobacteriales bacterium]|nr:phenylacetate-CoA oxygenase/reductase subunit PaaK [Sphingobacteriales bacterium]MBI3719448.1 phenylacetate-CoA oxygenase/reductase subunit PaaK [Sphingobacteriales bacterium]
MSIHFHSLRIKDIQRETNDCVSVLFDVPAELNQAFRFVQGQNLTLKTIINNQEIRRSYSICSSPLDKQLRVAIKKVDGGLFSGFANEQLKAGDVLDVMQPSGKFYTPLNPQNKKHYVAFAAGSGITPVLSLVKATLQVEPKSTFTLVYGNRSRSSIIFFEELEALKNKYMQRFNLVHILSRERTDADINFGRITDDKLQELSKLIEYNSVDEFFLCGPEEMIFCIKDFLEAGGADKKKIHFELFTTQGQKQPTTKNQPVATVAPSASCNIIIKLDGRSITFNQPLNSETTILDAALKQGADLPYACKGGMCCTCKAKLLEGEVDMDVHWGLEDEEINEGFILTCQSHPKTEKVVIDFDVR